MWQDNLPHTTGSSLNPLVQGRLDPCSHVFFSTIQMSTRQTRRRFSNLVLNDFGESMGPVDSVSCSWLTGVPPGVVLCCCSPSASRFTTSCVQRCSSAHLSCNEMLFELLLFSQFEPVRPFTTDLWVFFLPENCWDIFSFSGPSRDGCG